MADWSQPDAFAEWLSWSPFIGPLRPHERRNMCYSTAGGFIPTVYTSEHDAIAHDADVDLSLYRTSHLDCIPYVEEQDSMRTFRTHELYNSMMASHTPLPFSRNTVRFHGIVAIAVGGNALAEATTAASAAVAASSESAPPAVQGSSKRAEDRKREADKRAKQAQKQQSRGRRH